MACIYIKGRLANASIIENRAAETMRMINIIQLFHYPWKDHCRLLYKRLSGWGRYHMLRPVCDLY